MIKKLELCLMLVSVLLKIKFGHTQISVPKIGIPMLKTACINLCRRCWFYMVVGIHKDVLVHLSTTISSLNEIIHLDFSLRYLASYNYLIVSFMEQWPSGQGTGFPIQGSHVQNHWVAPRSTQPFILPRSVK